MTMPTAADLRRVARLVIVNAAVFVVLIAVVEGASSLLLFSVDWARTEVVAEQLHTSYDPDLGWVNRPDVHLPDMYGHGIYLNTNHQRFRGARDVAREVPAGKRRIVCSGDSFTLGFGVDDDHTWCSLLGARPGLETVNMGQGGYGIDQAYLWYKRDAADLRHDVQILAFIDSDFKRMQSTTFLGYGKPMLDVEGGALTVKNVPVPRVSRSNPLNQNLRDLRAFELLRRIVKGHHLAPPPASRESIGDERTRKVLAKMLADLKHLDEQRGSRLVLLYLPEYQDYVSDTFMPWRAFFKKEAEELGIPLIDPIDDLRKLSPEEISALFIPKGAVAYAGAAGHYTDRGHAVVEGLVHERLTSFPEIAAALDPAQPRAHTVDAAWPKP